MSNRFKPKYNIKRGDSVVVITGDDNARRRDLRVLGDRQRKGGHGTRQESGSGCGRRAERGPSGVA